MGFSRTKLRAARVAAGMNRDQLARRVGCTVAAVTQWETAKRTPTVANICALAAALDVRPGDLFETEMENAR